MGWHVRSGSRCEAVLSAVCTPLLLTGWLAASAAADMSWLESEAFEQMYERGGFMVTDDGALVMLAGSTLGGGELTHHMRVWLRPVWLTLHAPQHHALHPRLPQSRCGGSTRSGSAGTSAPRQGLCMRISAAGTVAALTGTKINWTASLKPPPHVRQEWASGPHGLTHLGPGSAAFDDALDKVCRRLGVSTGTTPSGPNAKLTQGLQALGEHVEE